MILFSVIPFFISKKIIIKPEWTVLGVWIGNVATLTFWWEIGWTTLVGQSIFVQILEKKIYTNFSEGFGNDYLEKPDKRDTKTNYLKGLLHSCIYVSSPTVL